METARANGGHIRPTFSRIRGGLCLSKYALLLFCALAFVLQMSVPAGGEQKLDLSNPSVRADYAAGLAKQSRAAKTEAESWAHARGIPVRHDDGKRLFELMYLQDGMPVYNVTDNTNAAISLGTNLIRNTAPYNLNGAGLTVGIWDGGAALSTHQEFGGRVTVMDGAASHYHSTHVAGTVGAAGVVGSAMGMAPSVYIDSYEWTNDTAEMTGRGASYAGEPGKIYVSSHSYGNVAGWSWTNWSGVMAWHWNSSSTWNGAASYERLFGQYNSVARNWDSAAYNAPYYLIFKSSGNDRTDNPAAGNTVYYTLNGTTWKSITYSTSTCPAGDGIVKGGYDTIASYGVAKNIMTVGAVNDAVSGGVRYLPYATMASFSGWGPADDGRIKPDIVANGIDVYSCYNTNNSSYATLSGTSMACPGASGSAILLAEYYGELFPGQAMRSSTLKALIIHTADDLGNSGPDYSYGWGLMNTQAAAALIKTQYDYPSQMRIQEGMLNGADPNETYVFEWNGSSPIRITICWTDPAATAITSHDITTPRLVNDLDLRIFGPGGSPAYYPYILNRSTPSAPATTGDNVLDNVEQVYVSSSGVAGTYSLRISYKGALTNGQQYYSLISSVPLAILPVPPAQATAPNPANTATNVSLTADISWTAGSDATSHDVYFGTLSPGTFRGNQAGTTYDTGTMQPNTTYFWRIDEKNAGGTTTGTVWSFGTNALVPNVAGLTQADANSAIIVAGLSVGAVSLEYSNTVPADNVISQDPSGGIEVSVGSPVNMTVSLGRPTVPDVTGMTAADANTAITSVDGLHVGTVTQAHSDTVAAGLVISQDPAGGTAVDTSSSVNLVISLGLPIIPDVTGQAQAAAEAAIVTATFTVGTETTAYSDTVAAGNVISQFPAGGTAATSGTAVDMVISLGSARPTISGYLREPDGVTPVQEVLVDANNGGGVSAISDANGYYLVSVPYGWSGIVTPLKEGFTFEPNGISYNNIVVNDANDYVATLKTYAIRGHIIAASADANIVDVNVVAENGGGPWTNRYGGGAALSDPNGYYSIKVDYKWSGKVVPAKYAHAFDPNNISYTQVMADQNDQDFAATLLTFAISGHILNSCANPIADANVVASNGGNSTKTDPNGYYKVWVNYNWSGSVTPGKPHYTFAPPHVSYANVLADVTDQNYTGTNPYDLNCSATIDYGDLEIFAANWLVRTEGPGQNPCDFYTDPHNSIVDFRDYALFGDAWLTQP